MNYHFASYRNKPQVRPMKGDVVRLTSTVSGYELEKTKEYKVKSVRTNAKSYSVVVEGEYGDVQRTANHFDLIKRSEDTTMNIIDKDHTWMTIVNHDIVGVFQDRKDAEQDAIKHITDNYKVQVVIAEVVTVAKSKTPPIEFV